MRRAKKLHAKPGPKQPPKLPPPRNPVARSPLLGKGGPHGKSTGAKRRAAKVELRKLARESGAVE
jgi:hypothetical protein